MNWTTDKPTAPGWYWWRFGEGSKPIMTEMTSKNFSTAAVVSLSSGVLLCNFSQMHELAEHLMGHPIWTHQFASKTLWNRMRGKLLEQHPALPITEPKGVGGDNWQEYLAAACAMFGEELSINGSPSTGPGDPNE